MRGEEEAGSFLSCASPLVLLDTSGSLLSTTWKPKVMQSPHKGKTGVRRLINAFGYSINGLREAYRLEDAFRQEIVLAAVLVSAALLLPVASTGRALLLASVILVLIVELLNSAIEATVDRISLDNHELAKRAKDIGSAAVMLSLACMTIVWIVVLLG
jgi:diacylglycerol kinase (ATP)